MTGTIPVAKNLNTMMAAIHLTKLETLHFLHSMLSKWQPKRKSFDLFSTCPKLHHTRTAAHNHAFKAAAFRLAASLHKHLEAHCSLSHDTSLSQTVLAFEFVPSDSPLQLYSSQAGNSRLQTLQHYRWVLEDGNLILGQYRSRISYFNKKIAIRPVWCLPSDTHAEKLVETYGKKLQA